MTNHGWMCPACGSGCAPFCMQCPCVSQAKAASKAVDYRTVHGLYEYSVRGQLDADAARTSESFLIKDAVDKPVPSDSPVPPSKGLEYVDPYKGQPNFCSECGQHYPNHFSHCSKSTPFTLR